MELTDGYDLLVFILPELLQVDELWLLELIQLLIQVGLLLGLILLWLISLLLLRLIDLLLLWLICLLLLWLICLLLWRKGGLLLLLEGLLLVGKLLLLREELLLSQLELLWLDLTNSSRGSGLTCSRAYSC